MYVESIKSPLKVSFIPTAKILLLSKSVFIDCSSGKFLIPIAEPFLPSPIKVSSMKTFLSVIKFSLFNSIVSLSVKKPP